MVFRLASPSIFVLAWYAAAPAFAYPAASADSPAINADLRRRCVEVMRQVLHDAERFKKVHAAEVLLWLDYGQTVAQHFEAERASADDEVNYRIGIWRVLSQATNLEIERKDWVEKIRAVAIDSDAPDRRSAIESLGKLGYKLQDKDDQVLVRAANDEDGFIAACARWIAVNSQAVGSHDRAEAQQHLAELLTSDDGVARENAAYAFRFLDSVTEKTAQRLVKAADAEAVDSAHRVYLVSAAYRHAEGKVRQRLRTQVLEYARTGNEPARYEACNVLAASGDPDDLPALIELLEDPEPDPRVGAAYAILRIERRGVEASLEPFDWLVIGFYGAGMLSIGLYYARRTRTTEDYLLGGRNMRSWAVGLSLLASLLSTISYLSHPSEMIKHGPMIMAAVVAYPFIIGVVGGALIPFLMKQGVTSAYEILEMRLGLSVRLLGAFFFLALRLLWMAVILYATTKTVLVPMLGLDPWTIPLICAALGVVTVIYTSMGGLRAVVLTDVIQFFILLGGALLTVVLISVWMGGIGAWWPTQWAPHWDPPRIFDPTARVTFVNAAFHTFIWWVCTSGSDQIAVQRYLSTRDVKSARRALITTLLADTLVLAVLSALGLGLGAYFLAHPHMIPDGQTLRSASDHLFPRFVVFGLPVGISGLVVAAMLAAAMSSLSSGVNSSCSVITIDFIDRMKKDKTSETDHVRLAKWISWFVGAAVVGLSGFAGYLHGNLLEVSMRFVGLFVAPLFGLFFMALFVPWATTFGTLAGAAAAVAVGVEIYYVEYFGISFLWAIPLGLAASIAVGTIASAVPIKAARRDRTV